MRMRWRRNVRLRRVAKSLLTWCWLSCLYSWWHIPSTHVWVCVRASDLSEISMLKYGLCFSCVRMHVQFEFVQCAAWLRCVWVGWVGALGDWRCAILFLIKQGGLPQQLKRVILFGLKQPYWSKTCTVLWNTSSVRTSLRSLRDYDAAVGDGMKTFVA